MRVLKPILLGGAIFLLPLALIWLLLAKAFQLALQLMQPIEYALPKWTVLGVAMPHLSAVFVLIALCLLAGLFVRTKSGERWRGRLERMTLGKLPGYAIVRTLFAGVTPTDKPVGVALVEMENMHVIAFVMERHADGYLTLFVPSAPTPAVGSVYFAREDKVQTIDVSLKDAMMCISRLGVGADKLLAVAAMQSRAR
jgi:uncharacterized membrane protein